jgi:hypothetical protein
MNLPSIRSFLSNVMAKIHYLYHSIAAKERHILITRPHWHPAFNKDWTEYLPSSYYHYPSKSKLVFLGEENLIIKSILSKARSTRQLVYLTNTLETDISSHNATLFLEIENQYIVGSAAPNFSTRDYSTWLDSIHADKLITLVQNLNPVFICFSKYVKETCKKFPQVYGLDSSRVYHVPPSVTPMISMMSLKNKLHERRNQRVRVLGISTKFWGKGCPIFIDVARRCPYADFTLVISDDKTDIVDSTYLKSAPNLHIINQESKFSNQHKKSIFYQHDCFLQPLLQDGMGVHLDSIANGLPLITTDIFDKHELCSHRGTGFLVKTPYDLWSEIESKRVTTYSDFISNCKTHYEDRLFDNITEELACYIRELHDNRCLLAQLSYSSLDRCTQGVNSNIHRANLLDRIFHQTAVLH